MKTARTGLVFVLGLALMVLGFAGVADAQDAGYGSETPLSVSASVNADGSISGSATGGTAPYTISATVTADGVVTTVTGSVGTDGSYSFPAGTVPAGARVVVRLADGAGAIASASAGNGVSIGTAIEGPGVISNPPALIQGSFRTPLAPKSVAAAAGSGGGDVQLAFTGAQSSMLVVGGMSLVLVGGVAVLATRKRPQI